MDTECTLESIISTSQTTHLYNYLKHPTDTGSGILTGKALYINTVPNLAIIDIDIHHNLTDDVVTYIRSNLIKKLTQETDSIVVVTTAHGGLHIYCLESDFRSHYHWSNTSNRFTKVCVSDDFDVDVFLSSPNDKTSIIVLPNSVIRDNPHSSKLTYSFAVGDYTTPITTTASDIIDILGLELKNEYRSIEEQLISHMIDDSTATDDSSVCPEDMYEDDISGNTISVELFQALVEGLKMITIHGALTNGSSDEVALPAVVSNLYHTVGDFVTEDMVEEALGDIKKHGSITSNCKRDWYKHLAEGISLSEKDQSCSIGYLINAIKIHLNAYYNEVIIPLICPVDETQKIMTQALESWNECYSLTDFIRDIVHCPNLTTDIYIEKLIKILAFIDSGGYVLKVWSKGAISYVVVSCENQLKNYLNFDIVYTSSEPLTETGAAKASKVKNIRINPILLLRTPDIRRLFMSFKTYAVIGDNVNVFSLFQPPNPLMSYISINNDRSLVDRWYMLLRSQMYDEYSIAALDNFIRQHAYILQKHDKPIVINVKFSERGSTGKNYIDNSLQKLYGEFALIGITESQLNEKHNGGMFDKLYRSYDELSTDNYRSKAANSALKRLTNKIRTVRRMCEDSKQAIDYATDSINTNEPDLYGILKSGDSALLSRLCIMRFKERRLIDSEYSSYINVIDDDSFGYSLYCYLMSLDLSEYIGHREYDRYDSTPVQQQLLQLLPRDSLGDFIDTCDIQWMPHRFDDTTDNTHWEICKVGELREAYNRYMAGRRCKLNYYNLDNELSQYGIQRYDKKVKIYNNAYRVYRRVMTDENEYEDKTIELSTAF